MNSFAYRHKREIKDLIRQGYGIDDIAMAMQVDRTLVADVVQAMRDSGELAALLGVNQA